MDLETFGPIIDWSSPDVGFVQTDINSTEIEKDISDKDMSFIQSYESVVGGDERWQTTKEEAKELEFSQMQTKYFSVRAAIDATQNGIAIALLWNMLKDAHIKGRDHSSHILGAPDEVTRMTLFEAFTGMLILLMRQHNFEDIIPHGESGVHHVLAARVDSTPYPNETTLLPFSTEIVNINSIADPLRYQDIVLANDENIKTNKNIRNHINENGMGEDITFDSINGNESSSFNYQRLREWQQLYAFKFYSTFQTQAFGSHLTYGSWLHEQNNELATWIDNGDIEEDYQERLLELVSIVETAVESDSIKFASSFGSSETLLDYITRLITFFKSYTVDLKSVSIFMQIIDPAFETVRLMNTLAIKGKLYKSDDLELEELYKFMIFLFEKDTLELEDVERIKVLFSKTDKLWLYDGEWSSDVEDPPEHTWIGSKKDGYMVYKEANLEQFIHGQDSWLFENRFFENNFTKEDNLFNNDNFKVNQVYDLKKDNILLEETVSINVIDPWI